MIPQVLLCQRMYILCDHILIAAFDISASENETTVANTKKCDRIVICDPSHNEEAIMDGKLVIGINPYKEICTLHLAGQMIIDKVTLLNELSNVIGRVKYGVVL